MKKMGKTNLSKQEKTVVLVKPDALQRGLVGEMIHRFERKGLKLVGIKMLPLTDKILDQWYMHHKEKDFFLDLKSFMMWKPVVAMLWQGFGAIDAVRKIVGITKGREAEGGSIRGDFGMSESYNLIHASDGVETAEKEIKLIFDKDEIFEYESATDILVYNKAGR